jgi:hypothetical protein
MFDQLAIEFVRQGVNGRVHVFGLGVRKDISARDVHRGFSFLDHFLDDESDLRIGYLVKMPLQSLELALDVFSQGCGDFHVVATDVQLHK